jgi:adenine-specific DNA-methyltransferase
MIEEKSLDVFAAKLAQLREIFPEVLTEGKIDFNRLRDILGDTVSFNKEHYELSWAGKSEARAQIQKTTSATLIPSESKLMSFDSPQSGNIFIEGENLEVLHVLQRSYFGKIKMIYIDPPYNTGNDSFVYPDDYSERQDEYKKRAGITDNNGFLNKQDCWKKNNKENGQFHSVWLSMMYPRLYLARNLLREDGVIFISIDDNEQANLKLLCDEIFGAENFVANIIWQNSSRNSLQIAVEHEYLLVYVKSEIGKTNNWTKSRDIALTLVKNINDYRLQGKSIAEAETLLAVEINRFLEEDKHKNSKEFAWLNNYKNIDEDWQIYYAVDLSGEGTGPARFFNGVKTPAPKGRHWMSQEYIDELAVEGRIVWRSDRAYRKLYIQESNDNLKSLIRLPTRNGSELLKQILGKDIFDKPKPHNLIKKLAYYLTSDNDIILDFFAGSGTTAHAVLDLNEQDGGNRQFICVQMPELLEENSEAYKAGYKTIADICKARISKVIAKLQAERDNNKQTDLIPETPIQILGFKSFKLAPSNFKQWRGDIDENELLTQLELFKDSEQPDSENHAMLIELLLKAGFPLTAKIETITIAGQEIYNVESGKVLFFFDNYNETIKDAIFTLKPKSVVCLNRVFNNNDQVLTNFQLGLKDAGIELQII